MGFKGQAFWILLLGCQKDFRNVLVLNSVSWICSVHSSCSIRALCSSLPVPMQERLQGRTGPTSVCSVLWQLRLTGICLRVSKHWCLCIQSSNTELLMYPYLFMYIVVYLGQGLCLLVFFCATCCTWSVLFKLQGLNKHLKRDSQPELQQGRTEGNSCW